MNRPEWRWSAGLSNYLGRGKMFDWRASWGEYVNGEPPGSGRDRLWCWTLTAFGLSIYLQVDRVVSQWRRAQGGRG